MKSYLTKNAIVALVAIVTVELVVAESRSQSTLQVGFLELHSFGRAVEDGPAHVLTTDPKVMPDMAQAVFDDGTPEGGNSIIPHQVKIWKDKSSFPVWLQYLLASTWILMLASLPFLMPIMDGHSVTKSQYIVGAMMLVILFGGFYLFTNIILFQSGHFERVRSLTNVECIYFMAQVITTVGYGDMVPAKIRGQVFVAIYVLGALFIIAMLISDITAHVVVMAKKYKDQLSADRAEEVSARSARKGSGGKSVADLVAPEKPSTEGLIIALAVFFAIDICWVLFFHLYPGEDKSLFQAVYMSVITLSTVGFGYFTPVTEAGMVFAAFFMIFGSAALVNVITNFTELMVKLNEWERFCPESKAQALEELKGIVEGNEQVSEVQFLRFSLLQMKCLEQTELKYIHQAFQNLNPSDGKINLKDVMETLGIDAK